MCSKCWTIDPILERQKRISKQIDKHINKLRKDEEKVVKLSLFGTGESGKSTIMKQFKIINLEDAFDKETGGLSERTAKISVIRHNIRDAILTIVGAMNLLGIAYEKESSKEGAEYLMRESRLPNFDYPQKFYEYVKELWTDTGVQKCVQRSNEYQLIDSAIYFLDKADIIGKPDYIPTNQDILRCRHMTHTIQRTDFVVKDGRVEVPFSVFDVGGQRGERRKWIQLFDRLTAILFVLDCSSYDLTLREDRTKNRLIESMELFEQIWNSRWLQKISIILFINKIDVLKEKINKGRTLPMLLKSLQKDNPYFSLLQRFEHFRKPRENERRECLEAFPNGEPGSDSLTASPRRRSRTPSLRTDIDEEVVRTAVFIKRLFLNLSQEPVNSEPQSGGHDNHFCEVYYTCAVDTQTIKKVLEGCRSLIIKEHLLKMGISI